MSITTTKLTRAAGLCAVAAGLLFAAVQFNHPHLDANFVTTTEWTVRQTMKVLMAVLALLGITGMYLRQVKQTGVLGVIGYVLFSAGYLTMLSVEVIGTVVLPSIAHSAPEYVNDVLAASTSGQAAGDIGLMQPLLSFMGIGYLGGGLLFGIALFRANILARWAAVLLAVGTVATIAIPLLPQINERLLALPTAVALVGLGISLWREQRAVGHSLPTESTSPLDRAGAK
ncbi:hypothetical protein [Arthrobacter sp. MMS18-M83]|uniref:hypothetical protein n=1 Tax=Arthrobacter sp. MMS18-M83 TaxID=2996261 RepID=UPI00227CA3F4|nr:hypothetical protein [Arthrobacter sp. MMS18-M83]WAH97158.1 hypothetical protein OW521_22895 [Arthrobacter sp. MMS18-M83]